MHVKYYCVSFLCCFTNFDLVCLRQSYGFEGERVLSCRIDSRVEVSTNFM
ncbi:hypothetical protein M758_2G072600 [Ceratodon purpureus]|uniref:Uncharacterized protein n=1 Tax=Ceratodon purpureus TaxID=3225 RepID=A0A8T0JDV1_CERPU|nr:hypothetical protein KC19_1G298700 [Ceratodon purpureus]KAG0593886.1 hypothetical protein M758_UG028300 [Ceratodon purpureus]KAG0593888.1 hypothetical protein M758_UG028500 [Ceratodon purpureus]KAG0594619.1 hypothetical protein M758_UG093700 [Ceratodon purpureus]KAG0594622.1 hypothetical protein M758_UG094000 [Ceratodon purpureus]